MSLFDCTSDVFDDASALEPSYQPEYFVPRGDVFEEYVTALQPLAEGRAGQHIFVHGRPGTGKSATTRYVLNKLQNDIEASTDRSLAVQQIVASAGSSSFKMLIKAVNELRDSRHATPMATTGHSTAEVIDALIGELSALNDPLVLVVDDAHLLSDPNVLFHELSRVRERVGDDHVGLTVIAISNGASLLDELEADTRSTLRTKRLLFPPFCKRELNTILQQRAQVGFKQSVEWNRIIALCSSLCVGQGGDVRHGINLLRVTGENAQQRLRDSSQESLELLRGDVLEAEEDLSTEWFGSTASKLTNLSRQVLTAVIVSACHGQTPSSTSEIHRTLSSLRVEGEISEDYTRDHLNDLTSQGVVLRTSKNRGGKSDGSGGQYYRFELPVSLDTALAAIPSMEVRSIDQEMLESLTETAWNQSKISRQQYEELKG